MFRIPRAQRCEMTHLDRCGERSLARGAKPIIRREASGAVLIFAILIPHRVCLVARFSPLVKVRHFDGAAIYVTK